MTSNSAVKNEIVTSTPSGIIIIKPTIYADKRGYFCETFRRSEFEKLGIPTSYVQENFSHSLRNTFRGLHLQYDKPQGKLISVSYGKAVFYELDARPLSPYFGNVFIQEMTDRDHYSMWLPPGMANGFLALSDVCNVSYKCTEYWNKESEISIRPDSASIDFHDIKPLISEKDKNGISLSEWKEKYFSVFGRKNIFCPSSPRHRTK